MKKKTASRKRAALAQGAERIAPALDGLAVLVGALHEDPANLNTHNDRSIAAIAASLRAHGQLKPIVATEDGVVKAGNGTLRAALSLGWDRIAVVRYNPSDPKMLDAFAIADNRTAQLAEWDDDALHAALVSLQDSGVDLAEQLAFDDKELRALLGREKTESPLGDEPQESYSVLVSCRDELQQRELLDRLTEEGIACRALIS